MKQPTDERHSRSGSFEDYLVNAFANSTDELAEYMLYEMREDPNDPEGLAQLKRAMCRAIKAALLKAHK
jgi:hypothetical protein